MSYGKRFTEDDIKRIQRRNATSRNHPANPAPNVEQDSRNGGVAKEKAPRLNPPVRLLIHSYRHKLADSDGVSAKAAIDGCVKAGILPDDTTAEIKEVRYRQTKIPKTQDEKTELIFFASD